MNNMYKYMCNDTDVSESVILVNILFAEVQYDHMINIEWRSFYYLEHSLYHFHLLYVHISYWVFAMSLIWKIKF